MPGNDTTESSTAETMTDDAPDGASLDLHEEAEVAEEEGVEDAIGIQLIADDPRIAELEGSLSELQARLRAVSAAYKQQQDEMAATRARLQRQSALREEVRRGEVVAEIFEPVQNLNRSIDAAKKGSSMEDMIQGLEMLQGQFLEAFGKLGLEEVPGKGTRFNPNLHEALSLVPVPDAELDGIIIEVFSSGYRIGQRLITPARVIVGQAPEPPAEAEGDEDEDEIIDADVTGEEMDGEA